MDELRLIASYEAVPTEGKKEEIKSELVGLLERLTGVPTDAFQVAEKEGSWEIWISTGLIMVSLWLLKEIGSWSVKEVLNKAKSKRKNSPGNSKDEAKEVESLEVRGKRQPERGLSANADVLRYLDALADETDASRIVIAKLSAEEQGQIVELKRDGKNKSWNFIETLTRDDFENYISHGRFS